MKAVCLGGTGAVGKELVAQLVANTGVESVVAIGRRQIQLGEQDSTGKLKSVIANFDSGLKAQCKDAMQGADVVFWTLGTTRKDAGSAAAFKKIELGYLEEAAAAAKEAGVKHFSLLTAQGSNAGIWASDFILSHPLLYARTKGQAEEFVKQQGFPRVSIFRPGLLERPGVSRGVEKLFSSFMPSVHVASVAKAMVLDALKQGGQPLAVYEDADIKKGAAEGAVA